MRKYQLTAVQRNCPVCFSGSAYILWTVSSRQAAQHFVLKEADKEKFLELAEHIKGLWGQDSCEVVLCDNCGFCYSNPYLAGDKLFYTLAHSRSNYPAWKWEYQKTYEVLAKSSKPQYRLLEIGAGDGAFAQRIAQDLISKENILCTEFSEYGRQRIQQRGIRCLSEDIRDLSGNNFEGQYDIICMFQVLEHMDQLDILFQKLNHLTRPGGRLFISVPNSKRIQFNELNGALVDMPPNHIGRWNKRCLEEIARRSGFQVVEHEVEKLNFITAAKAFLTYFFLQNAKRAGSLANRICAIKNPRLRKFMQACGAAFYSLKALPALSRITPDTGMSQWAHLIKIG